MADSIALYASLLAADEAGDAAALAAVAWQMYGELATTAADLGALRARFRVYTAAPNEGEATWCIPHQDWRRSARTLSTRAATTWWRSNGQKARDPRPGQARRRRRHGPSQLVP